MLYTKNKINLIQLEKIADDIVSMIPSKRVVLLYGELGAGKTQLVKLIGKKINIQSNIFSPTFLISKQYKISNNQEMHHYDLYRLQNFQELKEIGFIDVLNNKKNIVLIEWPDKIPDFIKYLKKYIDKNEIIEIHLSHIDNPDLRSIEIQY